MARVAGLSSFDDAPSAAGKLAGRFQVKEDNSLPALRPAASPVQYTGHAARAPIDNSTQQLAEALAKINPALATVGQELAYQNRQASEAAAADKIGGMTWEERQKAVKEGLPEFNDPWFKAAFMKQYGVSRANWRNEEMTKARTAEPDTPLDDFLAKRRKEDFEALGHDRFAVAGYASAFAPYEHSLRTAQTQKDVAEVAAQRDDGIMAGFQSIYAAGQGMKSDPATIHQHLQARMQQNAELLRLPLKDQNKLLVKWASQLADKGDLPMVKELMDGDRGGVGPLSNTSELAAHAIELKTHATRKFRELADSQSIDIQARHHDEAANGRLDVDQVKAYAQAHPEVYTSKEVIGLIEKNTAAREVRLNKALVEEQKLQREQAYQQQIKGIRDHDLMVGERGLLASLGPAKYLNREGHEAELSAPERRKQAVQEYFARSPMIAQGRGETPEQQFGRETEWLSKNGQVNEQWKSVLQSGPSGAAGASLTGDKLPEGLQQGAALYERLWAANPRLLAAHMDKDNYDFYEAMRVAKQDLKLGEKDAYLQAITVTRDPSQFQSPYWQKRFDDIDSAAKGVNGWFDGNGSVENTGAIGTEVARIAKFYSKLGLSNDKALSQATERVKASYTDINGHYIYTGDRMVPPNFKELVGGHLNDYASQWGEYGHFSPSDLTIRPLDNAANAWLVTTTDGTPAPGPSVFTLDTLAQKEADRQEAVRKQLVEQTNRNANRAAILNEPAVVQDSFAARRFP